MRTRTQVIAFVFALVAPVVAAVAYADATFGHKPIAYFVPEKRVRLEANITDPSGVKIARAYFKAGAQADYTFVPMQANAGRFTAVLPATNASADSMEYLLLAQGNDGKVSRTEAYKVAAKKSSETPAWQEAGGKGDVKIFTEIPDAVKPVASYSDSISMDVVESGARLGAAAGLYAAAQGGAAGSGAAAGAGSSGAATTTAAAATAGGLSTAAIVGGLALAGVAAAAAGGGGGGGGGSSGGGGGGSGLSFAGTYSGTQSGVLNMNCGSFGSASCTFTAPLTITVNSSNIASGSTGNGTVNCNIPSFGPLAQAVSSGSSLPPTQIANNGVMSIPGSTVSQSGATVTCSTGTVTFSTSPKSVSGAQQCSGTFSSPPESCSFSFTINYQGS